MQKNPIYADYNGSAPLCPEVKEYLQERLESGLYSNPNAYHKLGQELLMAMENARARSAEALGCLPKNLIFNSGSTEGISHVFFSLLDRRNDKKVVITSEIEHSAVVKCIKYYQEVEDLEVCAVKTLSNGVIDLDHLNQLTQKHQGNVAVVSIMAANNETGVIQPYQEIGKLCESMGIPFVCDTTQLIGKAPFDFKSSHIDFAFLSGHKIGSPTGSGLLIAKDPKKLRSLIIGGGQEKDRRGGTQNYLGNETLAIALETFQKKFKCIEKMKEKREEFEAKLIQEFPDIEIFGLKAPRLAGSSFLAFPGIKGSDFQLELEKRNIFITTSSACSDGSSDISKVLKAMSVEPQIAGGALRISLGLCSPLEYYDIILKEVTEVAHLLRKK